MTPDKNKKPLPSSTSCVFPEQPDNYQQWKAALHQIRAHYLKGQWRHCIARCEQILTEARSPLLCLHATFLHLYCALAYEAIARMAHPLSNSRIQILEQAKCCYLTAASTLPTAELLPDPLDSYDDDSSSAHSSDSEASEVLDYHQSSPRSSSPHNDASSSTSIDSSQDLDVHKPSPLRIRKSSKERDDYIVIPLFGEEPPTDPRAHSSTVTKTAFRWLHVCSVERYNADLASFGNILSNHVSSIDTLIQSSSAAQRMRRFTKRLASYDEDQTAKAADLKARIARLKSAGWMRERFRPERYQELCERALEEL